ncbi:MAG: hypothetical protein Q9168_001895 [Polycauliona sp. 1 TL-2023]
MSAILDRLPNEVLLEIVSCIFNADLDNFTSTCSIIRRLAANRLREHQKRKIDYATITYGDPRKNDRITTWVHPSPLLCDLLCHDLLSYPQHLFINDHNYPGADWEDGWDYDSDDKASTCGYQSRILSRLSEHLKPSMIPRTQSMDGDEDLTSEILEEGDIGATLGLLLNLLPNLTTLTITDFNEHSQGMACLRQILDSTLGDSTECEQRPKAGSVQPLSKLNHITFTRSDQGGEGDDWELAMWAPLFYLPSLRSVRADYVRASSETFHGPGHRSAIERLYFQSPDIDGPSLNTYLKDVKDLRHFELRDMDYSAHVRPRMLTQTLLAYAAHSLQYLEIRVPSQTARTIMGGAFFIGSLKGFRSLKTICLEAFTFIEPLDPNLKDVRTLNHVPAGRSCTLIDVLPRSAVHVRLLPCYDVSLGIDKLSAAGILKGLHAKAELLPNLERIEFLCGISLDQMTESAAAKGCREVGIELFDQHGRLN